MVEPQAHRSAVNSRLSRPAGRFELGENWPMPTGACEVTFSFIPPARNSASGSQLVNMQFQFLKPVPFCFQVISYIKAVFDVDAKQQHFHRALVCNGLLQQLQGFLPGTSMKYSIRSLDWFTVKKMH